MTQLSLKWREEPFPRTHYKAFSFHTWVTGLDIRDILFRDGWFNEETSHFLFTKPPDIISCASGTKFWQISLFFYFFQPSNHIYSCIDPLGDAGTIEQSKQEPRVTELFPSFELLLKRRFAASHTTLFTKGFSPLEKETERTLINFCHLCRRLYYWWK